MLGKGRKAFGGMGSWMLWGAMKTGREGGHIPNLRVLSDVYRHNLVYFWVNLMQEGATCHILAQANVLENPS